MESAGQHRQTRTNLISDIKTQMTDQSPYISLVDPAASVGKGGKRAFAAPATVLPANSRSRLSAADKVGTCEIQLCGRRTDGRGNAAKRFRATEDRALGFKGLT